MRLEALEATSAPPCSYPASPAASQVAATQRTPASDLDANLFNIRKPQQATRFNTATLCFASSRSASGLLQSPWLDSGLRLLCNVKSPRLLSTSSPSLLSSISGSVPARWSGEDRIAIPSSCTASWLSWTALGFNLRRGTRLARDVFRPPSLEAHFG